MSTIEDLKRTQAGILAQLDDIDGQLANLYEHREVLQTQYDKNENTLQLSRAKSESSSTDPYTLDANCNSQGIAYDSRQFAWSSELDQLKTSLFGIANFKPQQLKALNATLDGRDLLLIMPTGAGKSLVYQLPAFMGLTNPDGLTLVISPLVSLMVDQTMSLVRSTNIPPECVGLLEASTPSRVKQNLLKRIGQATVDGFTHPLRLLYVTPERVVKSKLLLNKLETAHRQGRLVRIAIDEVHCVSQWGHDFRPDYGSLHLLRTQFPGVPLLGLTATATNQVIVDIQASLGLDPVKCLVQRSTYDRPNLIYKVIHNPGCQKQSTTANAIQQMIQSNYPNRPGIVYCFSQKDTEDVAKNLSEVGIKSCFYHANIDPEYRSKVHQKWLDGSFNVIVATVAFGMGIDGPDVAFVLHHAPSKGMSSYYQESGRAGRSGSELASCTLFWRLADFSRLACMVEVERCGITNLLEVMAYCIDRTRCRRRLLLAATCQEEEGGAEASCSLLTNKDEVAARCDNCQRQLDAKANDTQPLSFDWNPLLNVTVQHIINYSAGQNDKRLTVNNLAARLSTDKSFLSTVVRSATGLPSSSWKPGAAFVEYFLTWALVNRKLKFEFRHTAYSSIAYIGIINNKDSGYRHSTVSPLVYWPDPTADLIINRVHKSLSVKVKKPRTD